MREGSGAWRGWFAGALVALAGLVAVCCPGLAVGAVQHSFVPGVSERISAGAPAGALVPGPVEGVNWLTVAFGRVWVADKLEPQAGADAGETRVDEFEGSTGAYVGQLVEEGGVSELNNPVGVGQPPGGLGETVEYVAGSHEGQQVVAVFSGLHLAHVWTGAGSANGSFTLKAAKHVGSLAGVAVDDSSGLTAGDVYVATFGSEAAFNVVDVFKGEPGGVEPAKTIGELRGTCATAGTCPGKEVPFLEPSGVTVSGFDGDVLVVDKKSRVDVFEPVGGGQYAFVRTLEGTPAGGFGRVGAVGVDATNGDIYVADTAQRVVDEFEREGVFVGRLEGPAEEHFEEPAGVGAEGDVYVAEFDDATDAGAVSVFGADVVVPDVETEAVSGTRVAGTGRIGVRLNGTVKLDGEGEASCWFEYGTSEAFGSRVPCNGTVTGEPGPDPVSAALEGLSPDTIYYYRLVAQNKNGVNHGEGWQTHHFTTPGPGLVSEGASDVSSTSVSFTARVNPNGDKTSFYFQYSQGPLSECEANPGACGEIPAAPGIPLGEGTSPLGESVHVQSLLPSTTYHYRLIAPSRVEDNPEGEPGVLQTIPFTDAERTFETQPAGGGLVLPDDRQWELVSPADKHGGVIFSPGHQPAILQAAQDGEAVSYPITQPTEPGAQGISEAVQVFSVRSPTGGWCSKDITLPHTGAVGGATSNGLEYRAFSEDLSSGLIEPQGPYTSLGVKASPPDSERTPYLRHDQLSCPQTEPAGVYQPLLTHAPGFSDVLEGAHFGGPETQLLGEANYLGATENLTHVILSSQVQLTNTKTPGVTELYEWSASSPPEEQLKLISLLPNGEPSKQAAQLGYQNLIARGAISNNGGHVLWSEASQTGHLYDTNTQTGKTVQLDLPQGGNGNGEDHPVFQGASTDGSRVFFTDTQQLTSDAASITNQPDLYECTISEPAGTPVCGLEDLTPLKGKENAFVQGAVSAISPHGTWVYLVANSTLATGASTGHCDKALAPASETCNLYALHYTNNSWETKLIARLSAGDYPDWTGIQGSNLANLTARSSPNGEWFTFMSRQPLTGYDNTDANSGEPDEEIYLYHATTNTLICASCNPTGAQPKGVPYQQIREGLVGGTSETWPENQGIAASLPGYTPYSRGAGSYQPRYLTDNGRLFFNSSDALVPQDINNNQDVYQYEPVSTGTCTTTSPTYTPAAEGCINLISPGSAQGESAFIDASETGNDTFFLTGERLTRQDTDTALDLYDAHTCTLTSPCPTEQTTPPPCTTTDACRQSPTPQPTIYNNPPSSTPPPNSNLTPNPPTPPKHLTNTQKLTKALKACHNKHNKHQRKTCETQAHHKYPTPTKHHTTRRTK